MTDRTETELSRIVASDLTVAGSITALVVALGVAGLILVPPVSAAAGSQLDTAESPPDPAGDPLGWEQGYWYNESIDVDQADGLSESELQRYKARTMARIERLRGLEFTGDVPIEFIGPEAVAGRLAGNVTQFRGPTQQWEALFVVGEERNASRVQFETLVAGVAGWAAEEGSDSVVLVTPDPDEPTAPYVLLAHELVHVLQHQQFDLDAPRYQRTTMDGEQAKDALVEGEASYLHGQYAERCESGQWECLSGGQFASGPGSGDPRLRQFIGAPYTLGANYVAGLVDSGGFDRVDEAHRAPPRYSVEALLPGEPIAPTEPATVPDRSSDGWRRQGEPGRIGTMALYSAFPTDADRWRNGAFYVYTNGSADGYVWETTWASAAAAQTFEAVYTEQIRIQGGESVGESVWRIPDGPYADAFAIDRTDRTVRIVNAPDVASLSAVHGSPTTSTTTSVDTTAEAPASDRSTAVSEPSVTTVGGKSTTTSGDAPGFGAVAALLALVVLVIAKVRSGPQ